MATKKVTYVEPDDFFPKAIREKHFGEEKKKTTTKKTTTKKTTKKGAK